MSPNSSTYIKKLIVEHWFDLFLLVSLSALPLYFLTPNLFVFKSVQFPFFGSTTYYGGFVYITLLIGFVLWFGLNRGRGTSRKELLSKLGFKQNLSKLGIGLMIGCGAGAIMWYSQEQAIGNLMAIISSDSLLFIHMAISAIVAAPLLEEMLFRGYLINKVSRFKEKFLKIGILAIFSSIFLFAFIHFHAPLDKLIGGAVFTVVYVWGWKKNLSTAVVTHSAANSTIVFLGYMQAGAITAFGILPMIIALSFVLILILLNINQLFEFTERICSAWLRFVDSMMNR